MTTMLMTTMTSILASSEMYAVDYANGSDQNMTHGNDSFSCNVDMPPTAIRQAMGYFSMALYLVVCIVGLLGNTLVIYVVLRYSKMQTVTNMYIVNLAVADECFLIGIPFLFTTMLLERWPFGNGMCKVYMTTTSINQFTSSIFLTIMSADRYVAVCHPISSPRVRTPFISKVVSLTAWTASALLMVPVFMYASEMERGGPNSCNILWPESENVSGQTAFTLYSFILGFAIPLVLIFVFYILVIRKLKTVGPKNKSKEKKKTHRKVTKMVLIVITVYVLCWLPYWITQVALIFTPPNRCQNNFTVTVFLFAGCLSYSNSAMNPILYAFLSDNFKKSFMKACTCAAGKDVNATLHMENSVFPRGRAKDANKNNALKAKNSSGLLHAPDDDDGEVGPLVSRADQSTTAITMTSRSNVSSEVNNSMTTIKNGTKSGATLMPTQL
ncbi:Allatostatin-C Receptor [Frankliniella occidentalis]|uniref:Somatostatin receptor type 2-like n=1 Tax=Frankliniella occidentalis TaxID=133901 RepID=A0A6J1TUS1_FRAOC|nr:somatostatin receptor type 2-like [Frankliniella occidentalis]XP_026294356.1 somatostatin receptor type 2-like [Frankliniella occidentalis]XP_052120850.1 somatostatin receptor type 2-like [Frankliniella occidentalis]KAE8749776.1 Allatostatin-C Receptor [Frankliniella occidentalis]